MIQSHIHLTQKVWKQKQPGEKPKMEFMAEIIK